MRLIFGYTYGDWQILLECDGHYVYTLFHLKTILIRKVARFSSDQEAIGYFSRIAEKHIGEIDNGFTPTI